MSEEIETLLSEIDAYCAARGWTSSTFCTHAANDGKFADRLRSGGRCWPETMEKIRAFIADNPPEART